MAGTVVIYKSIYGATKKYAEWIAHEVKADVFLASQISRKKLSSYSTVIIGGGLYGNKISIFKTIIKYLKILMEKRVIIFTCGLTAPENESNRVRILEGLEKQIPKELLEKAKIFHLHGFITYSRLHLHHRFIMKMLKKALETKREEDLSIDEKHTLEALGQDHDFVDSESIKPIVDYVLTGEPL